MLISFRIIAFLEGLSYLLLIFFAVPVKYLLFDDYYVRLLGMPHGVLFLLYIIFCFLIRKNMNWNIIQFCIVLTASIIPCGTFYIERNMLKNSFHER